MKKILSLLLGIVMSLTIMLVVLPPIEVSAAAQKGLNTDVNSVSGSEFTQFEDLAKKLDSIFAGKVGLYSNISLTKSVTTKLGTKTVPPGTTLYWKCSSTTCSGQSCFAYAVSAYCTLYDGTHPQLTLNSKHERITAGNGNTISYNNFVNWGVRDDLPVYIRIGSDGGGDGHSIIVLTYTKDYITYLDGNGDNKGLIAIRKEPWKNNFDSYTGSNIYARKISYIVQPKDSYYPTHKCTEFEGLGVCTECGKTFDWEKTLDKTAAGTYKVTSDFTPRTNAPYSDATKASTSLKKGDTVEVIGAYTNAYGSKFYKFTYNSGKSTGYVYESYLSFSKPNALSVQCTGFKPSSNASLPQGQSYTASGTISSNYPLKSVEAYLDGSKYTTWTASDQKTTSLNIQSTVISSKLNFANMSLGTHTIKLKATDVHNQTSTFFTVSFNIVNNPANNTLRVNYHVNGGTITGSNYYLSDSMVYLKSTSKLVAFVCQYGVKVDNGLHNDTTFGLVRDGYKFVGWSLTADGSGEIFDQDMPCKPEDLVPDLVNGNKTVTMYAIWEKIGCDHSYTYKFNSSSHWKECRLCGDKQSASSHTYSTNCDTSCNVCGATRTITHTYSSTYSYNSVDHWKTCTVCGYYEYITEHSYSNSCDTTCNTCGYIRSVTHYYKSSYQYDTDTHWKACAVCGNKENIAAHTYQNKDNASGHCKECTVCGKIELISEHTPKTEYTYSLRFHWIQCSICDGMMQDAEDHIYTDSCDATCNTCGYTREAEHIYSNEKDKSCNICGETRIVENKPNTKPNTNNIQTDDEDEEYNNSGMDTATIIIVAGTVGFLGLACVTAVWGKKNNNSKNN